MYYKFRKEFLRDDWIPSYIATVPCESIVLRLRKRIERSAMIPLLQQLGYRYDDDSVPDPSGSAIMHVYNSDDTYSARLRRYVTL